MYVQTYKQMYRTLYSIYKEGGGGETMLDK